MNRRHFFLGLSGLAGCTRDRRPRINVFNWSDYIAPDTISNFEKESGIRVHYAVYESNEEMLAKVFTGNSGWDVVFPSNYFLQPMVENRLVRRLDQALLKNLDALEPRLRHPAWDPQLSYTAPYMWGGAGIVYNRKLEPKPRGWADLWNARLKGRLTMLDDPAEGIGAALKKLGRPLNSTDARSLEAARVELVKQKPLVRAYLNAEARDQLVAGDLLAAQLWATTAQQAIEASSNLAFVFPEEGYSLYCDGAVILEESKRAELAHKFIDYLLRPEVAAKIVAHSKTATANGAARALLPAAIRENQTLYPDQATLDRGEWFATLPSDAQRLRDRIWTEVKSA